MIDQSSVNLLDLISTATTLRRVAGTEGGEYKGPCPFCGGEDRLSVQPNYSSGGRWACRNCSPHWQDAIAFYRKLHPHLTFKDSCHQLGLQTSQNIQLSRIKRRGYRTDLPTRYSSRHISVSSPRDDWQRAARTFFTYCAELLWCESGKAGVDYLFHKRGLTNREMLEVAQIGYNPKPYFSQWGNVEVYLPRGIVIPWIIDNQVWGVNVRDMDWREGKANKYRRAKGSQNAVYGVQRVTLNSTVFIVETELDSLLLHQEAHTSESPIVAIATGSTSWGRSPRWVSRVALADKIIVAFDRESDSKKIQAVEMAAAWWLNTIKPKGKRLLPTKHDITEMKLAGDDVASWIRNATIR